ncbi:MAG TPA: cupin domain-containing protein [Opitutaceae bacterium]|jgi:quercetin dioxygenase-like cupin family protein|nr:cupin domain-containing protein [Opitutaceae bacterium]
MPRDFSRRSFLQHLPLGAAALALAAKARAEGPAAAADRAGRGFRVGVNEDRGGEELHIMGGKFDLKVSTQDSGGDLLIYDTTRLQRGGPALHRHFRQDEWFYILRGEFIVKVGEDTLRLGPGDSAFAPRMIPHAWAMVSEGPGQVLVLFQPAGSMEDFFHAMSRLGPNIPKDQEVLRRIWASHGQEMLGPPLAI